MDEQAVWSHQSHARPVVCLKCWNCQIATSVLDPPSGSVTGSQLGKGNIKAALLSDQITKKRPCFHGESG
ncbi:hypothetical protein EUGRSUZ_L02229 [Eucalyptus grandis]|uniref:Uncharacterized protein n=1 Tax=Eucalyptus grandis TaxID=71139 RepID=A0A058ZTF7_EUCGR|nr:hypothetical protein EUGRSUZ_L02229 [Eucalyptus grandis]